MAGIQSARSTNCMAAVPGSNSSQSGRLATKVATATPRAIRLVCSAFLSPLAMTARPPMMGSQMTSVSQGNWGSIRG